MNKKDQYEDIINLPHHVSKNRKPMTNYERAAQFLPFDALTGYKDVIIESSRTSDKKIEISENQAAIINEKLLILETCKNHPLVTITYFQKDKRKSGGKYITLEGKIKRINDVDKTITLQDETIIKIDDLYDVKADLFDNL